MNLEEEEVEVLLAFWAKKYFEEEAMAEHGASHRELERATHRVALLAEYLTEERAKAIFESQRLQTI